MVKEGSCHTGENGASPGIKLIIEFKDRCLNTSAAPSYGGGGTYWCFIVKVC